MKRCCQILIFSIVIISSAKASDLRGNVNLSYQGTDGGSGGQYRSTFSQVANLYTSDRLFYSNDLTLGAFIFHSKANQTRGDFRVRYSLNMLGYGYSLYSSYSPYTVYRGNTAQKFRVFQSSLSLKPGVIPAIATSYASTRQYTTDHPRSQSGSSYQWNIGSQYAKSFGSFRAVYQKQQVKSDGPPVSQRQVTRSVNLGYDIAKQFPARISWAGDYSFISTQTEIPDKLKDNSRTHIASLQAARSIGRWLSLSASTSGRLLDFYHDSNHTRIEDILANGSASMRLRENLSFVILRGYSLSQSENDTTTKTINSFVNFGGLWTFPVGSAASSRLAFSRGVYYKSVLGTNTVDNATLILDTELYRRTSATLNLGAVRSRKTASGYGRYQMTRSLDIVSRPVNTMSVNINYQSSEISNNINFINRLSDNLSVNATHVLKYYFNYTVTYTRSRYLAPSTTTISTVSLAANYRLSSALSLLGTYSRRDLGAGGGEPGGGIDQSATGRISWMVSARSNLTLNYSISNINTSRQAQGFGGYFTTSF